ncbi:hypothetical protein FQN50_002622 [Emmonsiellopsis sp. PD_5]|nr:hypothetical protein FQN50_002622 [Emmonsiellopsis sp. PD_5]
METAGRDVVKYTASTVFILSASLLALSAQSAPAADRPVHSVTITFAFAGLSLLIFSRFASSPSRDSLSDDHDDDSIELSDSLLYYSTETSTRALAKLRKLTGARIRKASIILGLAICGLSLRIELLRELIWSNKCAKSGFVAVIPLFLWIYDYWRARKANAVNNLQGLDTNVKRTLTSILPILLLVISAFLASSFRDGWQSTYICPIVGASAPLTVFGQILGVLLDTSILIAIAELVRQPIRRKDGRRIQPTALWGVLLLIPQIGILTMSFLLTFIFICISQILDLRTAMHAFPSISISKAAISIIILHAAGYWHLRSSTPAEPDRKKQPHSRGFLRWVLVGLICSSFGLLIAQQKEVASHPIDTLISTAKQSHGQWAAKAKSSANLGEAVAEYQRRYNRAPPPGFDKWYEYATERSSVVIDDYDQIYHDLLPFASLSPQRLRDLTNLMVTDPWNDMAAVIIRSGEARIQEEILPTHRWMIEGVKRMIDPFAKYLPDMDVAFNINDECRVAVPWEDIEPLRNSAKSRLPESDKIIDSWSADRASTWPPSDPSHRGSHPLFVDSSLQRIFDTYGRDPCPPSSKARASANWDQRDVCVECAEPHSLDQFLKDWTLASDACHQPDLASLHGIYLSPSSLKGSQSLLPVFSQSKVSGFNDILYPSAWNYIDKVVYSPSDEHPDGPYADKQPTLFWRGATSEGFSSHGQWQGMTRQRLVHLANNHTSNPISILLPSENDPASKSYTYTTIPASDIPTTLDLHASIQIAEKIVRCDDSTCRTQAAEFQPGPSTDFQDHWKYRFLIDTDGAGFSGRFLPFLQSKALPFRTGLFRQWLDERLTPWVHFVPIDVRLHGLWSTVAYFSGARTVEPDGNGGDGGNGKRDDGDEKKRDSQPKMKTKKVLMDPHDNEGEFIAEEGRKWAEKALRKEDMEIYMFRLLLEWGRLTDDKRDELGFRVQ